MTTELALITGASCGVGFALAKQFARRGYDLIIADGYDEIHTAAAALTVFGTDVQAEQVSLCCADNAQLLHRRVVSDGRPVTVAALAASVNDAMCLDGSLDGALDLVDSSVRGTMSLARLQAERMATYGRGGVLLTASPEDGGPGLGAAVYAASSAFLEAFGEILQQEVRDAGVKVITSLPRPPGGSRCHLPSELARQALDALNCDGRPGFAARATDAVTTLAGRFIADRIKGPVWQVLSPTGEAV
ncbi:SDR family NAD(P)-dependent oxidoreductase [Mycobacterium asiaticum]|uniref:SDR family NAD(P)-dependent oxidoreductase n=1 Tax=Mycobacterium asiaticum TaxID=1790 RepID=UPI000B16923A|nr:SDR family NAD(P)-dependent oxidoreductase [Mycobacterium asiaticum]